MSQRHLAAETTQTSQTELPSEAVVNAVADAEGLDPIALETPLYEVIDPDALDNLVPFRGANRAHAFARIQFTYYGYEVQIHGDGKVVLDQE